MASRMMTLVAFLQAQNCSNLPGSWRHPATTLDFLTPEYYQRIARVLEEGKIQMAFFDDRLALPDRYTDNHAEAVNAGVRAVPRGARVRDDGPDAEGPRGVEHRHITQQR